MIKVVNRVVETTQTTGTGMLDLGGAQTGYRAFGDELVSGDQVYYAIEDDPAAPTVYEYGIGTWTSGSPNTLSRDTVLGSSNGGGRISLLGGTTYTVTGTMVAEAFAEMKVEASRLVPVGTCVPYSGLVLPPRYLWPLGQDVSREAYPALFAATTIQQTGSRMNGSAVITGLADTGQMLPGMPVCGAGILSGTTIASVNSASQITLSQPVASTGSNTVIVAPYGVGDGTTTFGIIDMRGVVPAGRDDLGGTAAGRLTGFAGGVDGRRLGARGGHQTHTLTVAQMSAHVHDISAAAPRATAGGPYQYNGFTGNVALNTGAGNSGATGGGQPHNIVQPTTVVNYILYAGA